MNTYPQAQCQRYRLLVLVPHIEARAQLRQYSDQLFAAGFNGAWSFPQVAPLATLAKPLTQAELKQAAALLRELSLSTHASGKFIADSNATCAAAPSLKIFGTALNLAAPDLAPIIGDKLIHQFNPLVVGCAVVKNEDTAKAPPPPALSFRAAAVANMVFSPMPQDTESGYSWRWKIEKLHWLPSVKR